MIFPITVCSWYLQSLLCFHIIGVGGCEVSEEDHGRGESYHGRGPKLSSLEVGLTEPAQHGEADQQADHKSVLSGGDPVSSEGGQASKYQSHHEGHQRAGHQVASHSSTRYEPGIKVSQVINHLP